MDLILDTSFLIDAERSKTELHQLMADDDSISMAAVTYAELLHGVEMADGRRRATRQAFVEAVAAAVPIIAYDRRVAATHATLLASVQRAGRPRGAHDLMIAATASTYDLTVVTGDPDGFDGLPGVTVRRDG